MKYYTQEHQIKIIVTILFFLITINSAISQSLINFSQIPYTSSCQMDHSHFIPLSEQEIVGISSCEQIYLKKSSSSYQLYTSNYSFSNSFYLTNSSLHIQKISNTEYIIPCIKDLSTNITYALGYINTQTKKSTIFKQEQEDIISSSQHQCGLFYIPNFNFYLLAILFNNSDNEQGNSYSPLFYAFQDKLMYLEKYGSAYSQDSYELKENSTIDCVYFNESQVGLLILLSPEKSYLYFSLLNSNLDIIKSFNTEIKDFLGINAKKFLKNFAIFSFDDYNKILISHDNNDYFYVNYLSLNKTLNDTNLINTKDGVKRQGNSNSINYLRINDLYFILGFSFELNVFLYLFNIEMKTEINTFYYKNDYIVSNSLYLFESYNESNIILINQNKEKHLEVYEFNIISCANNPTININSLEEYELDLSLLYHLNNEFNLNEQFNISNLSVKIYDVDPQSIIDIKGINENNKDDEYYSITENLYYKKIKYALNQKIESTINFKYLLNYNYHNLNIPSFLCNGEFVTNMKIVHCIKFTKFLDNNICTKCEDGYYIIIHNYNMNTYLNYTNLNLLANCYNEEISGYYIDFNDKTYKKCYDTCLECDFGGNETNHNCTKCVDGLISIKNYIKDYPYDKCVEYCDLNSSTWFINIDNEEFVCQHGVSKCEGMYCQLEEETRRCIYNKNLYVSNNKIKLLKENNLKYAIELLNTNPLFFYEPNIIDYVENNEYILFNFDTLNIDNSSISYISKINLSNCEDLLYTHYSINKKDGLYISLIEIKQNNENILTNQIEYSIFDKSGNKLDLSICKKSSSKLTLHQTLNRKIEFSDKYLSMKSEYNINILNINDPFFSDICKPSPFNSNDILLVDRVNDYFLNFSICDDECDNRFENLNFDNLTVDCICNIKTNLSDKFNERKNVQRNKNFDNNSKIYGCIKTIFSKNIYENYGFYTSIVILFLEGFIIKIIISKIKDVYDTIIPIIPPVNCPPKKVRKSIHSINNNNSRINRNNKKQKTINKKNNNLIVNFNNVNNNILGNITNDNKNLNSFNNLITNSFNNNVNMMSGLNSNLISREPNSFTITDNNNDNKNNNKNSENDNNIISNAIIDFEKDKIDKNQLKINMSLLKKNTNIIQEENNINPLKINIKKSLTKKSKNDSNSINANNDNRIASNSLNISKRRRKKRESIDIGKINRTNKNDNKRKSFFQNNNNKNINNNISKNNNYKQVINLKSASVPEIEKIKEKNSKDKYAKIYKINSYTFNVKINKNVNLSIVEILKKKSLIGFNFEQNEEILKKFLFFFLIISYICFILAINSFLFDDNTISEYYKEKKFYNFFWEIPKIVECILFGKCRILFNRFVISVTPDKNKKIKFYFLIFFFVIIDAFLCYFVTVFCAVFVNSKKKWIISCLISIVLDTLIELLSIIFMFLFQFLAKKYNKPWIYIISETFFYL